MKHCFLANAYTELKLIELAFTWKLLETVVLSRQGTAGSFHVSRKKDAKIVLLNTDSSVHQRTRKRK